MLRAFERERAELDPGFFAEFRPDEPGIDVVGQSFCRHLVEHRLGCMSIRGLPERPDHFFARLRQADRISHGDPAARVSLPWSVLLQPLST
ncbi:MAG: hypothetical protein R3E75_05495, partial [Steroidobacteraceae bacterium]